MSRALVLACCAAACVSEAPRSHGLGDAATKLYQAWPSAGPPGRDPDLKQALFYARSPGTNDRAELRLDDFVARVQKDAQATQTHLWITVANPNGFQAEAVIRMPIPPGAAVTRAVLHVGTEAVEGAFVSRDRARAIYRSITERRRDPALVTWAGPAWLEATVFPVEKSDRRTLELEWIEPTASRDGCAWYRVPVIAHEGGNVRRPSRIVVDGVTVDTPGRSWLPLAVVGKVGAAAMARGPGEPLAYAVAPSQERKPEATRLVVVAETSREMSPPERKRQRELIERLLDALPDEAGVTLLAVDWTIASVTENASPAEVRAALDHLDNVASAGALDLENALLVASARARAIGASSILFVGKGADAFPGDGLTAPLRQMHEAQQNLLVVGHEPLALADAAALTGGEAMPWTSTRDALQRVLALLGRTAPDIALDDSESFYALETVTGETRWLTRFAGAAPSGLQHVEVRALEALWARAHVAATSDREDDQGRRHSVLTPLTSILVLESKADYARWGIQPPANEGDAWLKRKTPDRPPSDGLYGLRGPVDQQPHQQPHMGAIFGRDSAANSDAVGVFGGLIGNEAGEANGVAGLGLVGTGAGGGGTGLDIPDFGNRFGVDSATVGYGRGAGGLAGRRARALQVVAGQATVRGSLDRQIIRRIIRRHINEVKYCYEQELPRQPKLGGRISVQFTISAAGQVIAAFLQSSTLSNARVESCVVRAVRRWEFPRTYGSGISIVSYPFDFVPGDFRIIPWIAEPIAVTRPRATEPWNSGLQALLGKGESKERTAKVAEILDAPTTSSPAVLAWWIVERYSRSGLPVPGACILAANLLREAGQPHEAGRVLSEAGSVDLEAAAAEFRRWASTHDVTRLGELAARK